MIHQHTELLLDLVSKPLFGGTLHLLPPFHKGGVALVRLEQLEGFELVAPAGADRLIQQGGEARVGHSQPSPRRHPVRHVGEALGPESCEVGEHVLLQQLAMELRHTVGAVAAHHGQMGHAHLALGPLFNQRHALQQLALAGMAQPHHAQEAGVDLVDDLQLPGQQLLE